ncbi:hypothetical protein HK405_009664, partial [Cladochytrium tenue]
DTFHERNKDSAPRPPPARRIGPDELSRCLEPPIGVRILARDFIHDSLYNPHYGYFSKKARIFSPKEPIQFNSLRDSYAFMNHLAALYKEYDGVGDPDPAIRQPLYGYAVANYILSEYRRDPMGAQHLDIYEIGGGNGTLMTNILDYIREHDPDVYARTRYTIVEISASLADLQRRQPHQRHGAVRVVNKSIFDWDEEMPDACFVVAMEVVDNFAHDVVRYGYTDGTPYQGVVLVDDNGDYTEAYEPVSDGDLQRILALRDSLDFPRGDSFGGPGPGASASAAAAAWLRRLRAAALPFAPNLTQRDFVPTRLAGLLEALARSFPRHRLLLSDFDALPDAVPGRLGPVVQTRLHGDMVACSTYLVQPGWFDIFFPTDFDLLRAMHARLCAGAAAGGGDSDAVAARAAARGYRADIVSQSDFLRQYADLDRARTRSGE